MTAVKGTAKTIFLIYFPFFKQSLNEGVECFKKAEQTLKWRDFILNSEEEFQVIKDRTVYNAVYRHESQEKVTLVVSFP